MLNNSGVAEYEACLMFEYWHRRAGVQGAVCIRWRFFGKLAVLKADVSERCMVVVRFTTSTSQLAQMVDISQLEENGKLC